MFETTGMGTGYRKEAVRTLRSKLPLVLAEHLFKYQMFPKARARAGWKKEINTFLTQLMRGVASFSKVGKAPRRVLVTDLHFSADQVMQRLDGLSIEGMARALEGTESEELVLSDDGEGNLTDYGWSLVQSRKDGHITWTLKLGSEVVAEVG